MVQPTRCWDRRHTLRCCHGPSVGNGVQLRRDLYELTASPGGHEDIWIRRAQSRPSPQSLDQRWLQPAVVTRIGIETMTLNWSTLPPPPSFATSQRSVGRGSGSHRDQRFRFLGMVGLMTVPAPVLLALIPRWKSQPIGRLSVQNCFEDIRRQQGQPQDTAHVPRSIFSAAVNRPHIPTYIARRSLSEYVWRDAGSVSAYSTAPSPRGRNRLARPKECAAAGVLNRGA